MDKLLPGLTPEQLIEIQKQQLYDIAEHIRSCEKRVKGFGYAVLDDMAAMHNMSPELKDHLKKALDEPDKDFVINFKPTILKP